MNTAMSSDQSPQPAPSKSKSWLILLILIAPAILTLISVADAEPAGQFIEVLTFYGSPLAGTVAGWMFASNRSRPGSPRILTTLITCAAFSFLSFALCFVACLAGAAIHNH